MARPTIFNEAVHGKMVELSAKGSTNKQIADMLGVNPATVTRWLKKNIVLRASIKEAKSLADRMVEASLYQRALGFEKTYSTEVATKDGVERIEKTDYFPPDPTSCIFWLKNRQPAEWRDKPKAFEEAGQPPPAIAPGFIDLLTSAAMLTHMELERLKAKAQKEGLSAEDHRSVAVLSRSLLETKEAYERIISDKRKIVATMSTEQLREEARKILEPGVNANDQTGSDRKDSAIGSEIGPGSSGQVSEGNQ